MTIFRNKVFAEDEGIAGKVLALNPMTVLMRRKGRTEIQMQEESYVKTEGYVQRLELCTHKQGTPRIAWKLTEASKRGRRIPPCETSEGHSLANTMI